MPATRAAIRRRAVGLARVDGRGRGYASRDNVTALTSTSGTTTSLTDTAGLPPTGAATTWAKDWWLYLPTVSTVADRKRLIASYTASTRTITHDGPAYASGTATELVAGRPYLILKDDPDLWNSAVNEALRTLLSEISYDEFTPTTTGTLRYTVANAPVGLAAVVRPSQIVAVETQAVGGGVTDRWRPWNDGYRTWQTYMDGDDVVLDFIDRAPTTADRIRIKWSGQYMELTDETTSRDVDEYWAALATCSVMADWLADPNNADDDWNMIGTRVRRQYFGQRRLILGEDAFRSVVRPVQQSGMVGIQGRMGRRR